MLLDRHVLDLLEKGVSLGFAAGRGGAGFPHREPHGRCCATPQSLAMPRMDLPCALQVANGRPGFHGDHSQVSLLRSHSKDDGLRGVGQLSDVKWALFSDVIYTAARTTLPTGAELAVEEHSPRATTAVPCADTMNICMPLPEHLIEVESNTENPIGFNPAACCFNSSSTSDCKRHELLSIWVRPASNRSVKPAAKSLNNPYPQRVMLLRGRNTPQ